MAGRQYCSVLMRCPLCGCEDYRRPVFTPAALPLYKGHEERRPEWCMSLPPVEFGSALCRGQMEIVPGFNHDLTLNNFEVDMETLTDGKVMGKQRISSLHEIRQIEEASLRRHANGEGQPLVFRDLSQNKSNRSVNTLTNTPYEKHRSVPGDVVRKMAKTHAGKIRGKRITAEEAGA